MNSLNTQKRRAIISALLKTNPSKGLEYLIEELREQEPIKEPDELHKPILDELKRVIEEHAEEKRELLAELERYKQLAKGEKGEKGDSIVGPRGPKGDSIIGPMGPKGDRGEDGRDGSSPSVDAIVAAILPRIPLPKDGQEGKPGKDAEINKEELIKDLIKYIQDEKPISAAHIRGIQGFVRDGVKYRVEELMHGGGIGASSILLPLSGAIDNSNTNFIFTRKPTLVAVNGVFYREGIGWLWVASTQTVTIANPVGTGGDIYAL